MNFAHGETVTVLTTTTTKDEYGDATTVPTEVAWGPCAIAPRSAPERDDPRAPAVVIGLTVYGPPIDLDADDQLRICGEVYDIDGRPGDWRSPFTGWHPGVEVAVKRAAGV